MSSKHLLLHKHVAEAKGIPYKPPKPILLTNLSHNPLSYPLYIKSRQSTLMIQLNRIHISQCLNPMLNYKHGM